ncbi:54S ribosomal protein L4 mitochondrial [Chamberlinius hualienensis]
MFIFKSLINTVSRPVVNHQLKKITLPFQQGSSCFRQVTTGNDEANKDFSLITPEDTVISRTELPIISQRNLQYPPTFMKPRQAWVENLDTIKTVYLGNIDLHPTVFAASPRLDFLQNNIKWQQHYRKISYKTAPTKAERRGGGRKPWPQKKTGRARHGSIRSPLFVKGGVAIGPRGPKSYFFMLPFWHRVRGLITALSMKHAQEDLHIINDLELPTDDPKFIESLIEERGWGPSVLFIDDADIAPRNFAMALSKIDHVNVMPVYGLNVFSMLKHETLVLTLAAVEKIEERLLFHFHRRDVKDIDKWIQPGI